MSENRSYKAGLEGFRRYQQGEMSLRDQHLFEKQMLEDPMMAEAYESFLRMGHSQSDLERIKNELDKRLSDRISQNSKRTIPLWAYGAAASLLVSLGTLWLVFLSDPKKGDMRETGRSTVGTPLIEPKLQQEPAPEAELEQAIAAKQHPPRPSQKTQRSDESAPAPDVLEKIQDKETAEADEAAAPAPAQSEVQSFAYSAKPAIPAGAAARAPEQARFRKSENVVTQTPVARRQALVTAITDSVSRFAPKPLMGWESYQAYLDLQTGNARREGEVVVTFEVNPDGTLSGFSVQGNRKLQKEAIRIVREGPVWMFPKQNAPTASKSASITVRFRK